MSREPAGQQRAPAPAAKSEPVAGESRPADQEAMSTAQGARPTVDEAQPVKVGVVGLGYWGPNLARNFAAIPSSELTWLCDPLEQARERLAHSFTGVRRTGAIEDLLEDPELDAVALATPVPTHAELAIAVANAGKHCFVEKPLATTAADAERAVQAAEQARRTLMVGHLLEYHPAVVRLQEMLAAGDLGEPYYVYSNRLNLGKLRADENALWSLGAHDVSVVLALIGEEPDECVAHGRSYVREGVEDVVFCYLGFPSGAVAHMHLSWLDPQKERRLTVVGSKRMATFDDMRLEGKLTLYDKGFDFDQEAHSWGEYSGDIFSPRVANVEPLRVECEHFIECVRTGNRPRSDGFSGVRVVRVLEQLQSSLDR